ncbi:LysR family transcriptional regulator [Pannonibacter phragmitetus]|uniref:LysR family transcriptional regulator n=1 Tax=Pannonibacter phragmitetus TaxID=121719 RepID=A0A0L0J0W5_9HYPH|nr:LysR family transcriptional regulator [Pannonibacter phragmitetus]ALV28249.1 LysR family transcriptional regulator [Pannonibacter phragmitetus]KND19233.1 LysR family transcriptional regulator [Pannonibacter phragmitetus]MBA4206187.1 HTH-type transcriptional activator AaeR [Polymorphum sp.]
MRLEDLRFFVRAAALGNLSAAGRETGLSPSAASSRLASLERDAGVQLVSRTTRRLQLTDAGELLLRRAGEALDLLDGTLRELEDEAARPRGTLRVSLNMFFGRKHVLPYLAEFRDLYPELRLQLDFSDRIVDLLAEGYDLAIRGAPLADSTLRARRLAGNPRVLCASPAYLARKGMPETPSDLARHDCLSFRSMPVWYFEGPQGEIACPIDAAISGDNGDFAYDAALLGLGLAVKSLAHVWEDLRDGRLVAVMTDFPVTRTGAIWAVAPPGRAMMPKARVLADFLTGKYGSPAYWETDYRQAGALVG